MLSAFESALWLFPGGVAGILTTLILWWTIRRARPGTDNAIRIRVWAGYILRLGIVAGLLIWAARRGIGPLLWAFVGLTASRWATIPLLVRWSLGQMTQQGK